jgi:hypothetical protein
MNHFSLENWADFANRVISDDRRASMERHLELGCTQCANVLARWQWMRKFAGEESLCCPPEDAVKLAKRVFRSYVPGDKQDAVRCFAELIFDSFRQPALEGVRNGRMNTRHLIYKAGNVVIDLQLEASAHPNRMSLVGQVMDSSRNAKGIQRAPVLIRYGQDTLAQTQTNQFGEFHLECEAGKSLQISVGVTARKDVFIPLDESELLSWPPRDGRGHY